MNKVSTNSESSLFQKEKLECLKLSSREMMIARLLAWGYTQKEIAYKLGISQLTVSVHLRNIYKQLDIHKETDLTRWYLFKEYCIQDDPFKKVLATLFLVLSCSMVFNGSTTMRVFRSVPIRTTVVRTARAQRTRRYKNVFDLQLTLTTA